MPNKRDHYLELARRCETEPSSIELDFAISKARDPMVISPYSLHLNRYTLLVDEARRLEPTDAQEICVRKYKKGCYVRISMADGTPIYCEVLDREITEALARTAAALRALAYVEPHPKTDVGDTQGGSTGGPEGNPGTDPQGAV